MENSIYDSISKTENAKELFNVVGKKYTKFSKNEKNKILNTLHCTFYDETSRVRDTLIKY